MLLPLVETQKKANQALDRAATVQQMTLTSALSQLPVDYVELWMRRREIAVLLPDELLADDRFGIWKKVDSDDLSCFHLYFTRLPNFPHEINGITYSWLNSLLSGT